MRIISGTHKGRHIHVRKNFPSRPTTDFAKENLFNVLNNHIDIEGLNILDLFAGTGGIGFEFASRGAHKVICVEKDFQSVKFIKKTLAEIKLEQVDVICANVFKYLLKCHLKFDVIFADPPYDMQNIDTLPNTIFENKLLQQGGLFILEHSADYDFSALPNFNQLRKYGSVHFSFFEQGSAGKSA